MAYNLGSQSVSDINSMDMSAKKLKMDKIVSDMSTNQTNTTQATGLAQGAQDVSKSDSVTGGALSGASAGAALGPWGAAAGAVIGGVVGGINAKNEEKAAKLTAEAEGLDATNRIEQNRNNVQTQIMNALANNLSATLLRR